MRSVLLSKLSAALVLGVVTVSPLEPVVGALRDGQVHHETVAAAAAHAEAAQGDHGHEGLDAPGQHEHGRQHRHGTASDHCTHVHGVGLAASFEFTIEVRLSPQTFVESIGDTHGFTEAPTQPPRA